MQSHHAYLHDSICLEKKRPIFDQPKGIFFPMPPSDCWMRGDNHKPNIMSELTLSGMTFASRLHGLHDLPEELGGVGGATAIHLNGLASDQCQRNQRQSQAQRHRACKGKTEGRFTRDSSHKIAPCLGQQASWSVAALIMLMTKQAPCGHATEDMSTT